MGRLIEASDGDFDAVTTSDEWVLVDFTAMVWTLQDDCPGTRAIIRRER